MGFETKVSRAPGLLGANEHKPKSLHAKLQLLYEQMPLLGTSNHLKKGTTTRMLC